MTENTNRFVQVVDGIYSGRAELGHSIEADDGRYEAFNAAGKLFGTFDSRIAARRAIIDAANSGDAS